MAKKAQVATAEEKIEAVLIPKTEQPHVVSENWIWIPWSLCGDFIAGSAFKTDLQGHTSYAIPFYKVGSLKYSEQDGYLYDLSNTITQAMRTTLKAALIPPNSIIFAKIGEAIRLNRRSLNRIACCIDNNLMAFLPNEACDYRYAFYWTLSQEFYPMTNATTVPAIRKSDLEAKQFPLPPLPEQRRIVARIESLFEKLDRARELAQNALETFETRKAAILHKAFTGELTAKWREENGVGMEWENISLDSLLSAITAGKSIRCLERPPMDDEVGIVKVSAVTWGEFDEIESKTCFNENLLRAEYLIHKGDFLFSRANTIQLVGACVIVANVDKRLMLSDKILRFSFNESAVPKYILFYLRSQKGRMQIENLSSGNQESMRNISQENIRKIIVPLPPKSEQQAIVRILDGLLEKEQQAKGLADVVMQIDLMKKAILARAFRGELGTNDPSEKSSMELLREVIGA